MEETPQKPVEVGSLSRSIYTAVNSQFAPENRPSQKEISVPTIHFQVRTVSFREGTWFSTSQVVIAAFLNHQQHVEEEEKHQKRHAGSCNLKGDGI